MWSLKKEWEKPFYRGTILYVAFLVTLIFGFQMYRYFWAAPADKLICPSRPSAISLVPVIGVFLDGQL